MRQSGVSVISLACFPQRGATYDRGDVRIAVCRPQMVFVRGGVEIFTDRLIAELSARGHDVDLVSIPMRLWPNNRIVESGLMWRLVDLHVDAQIKADLVIATKFPSYLIEHPNKVVWLVHQWRQAYELDGTEAGQLGDSPFDRSIQERVKEIDRHALGSARKLFATSRNVADRLRRSTGLEAEVLPHPPQELAFRCDGYGRFVLSVGRLDTLKRVDLLLEAAARESSLEIVVVGEGPDRARLEALSSEAGLEAQVHFAGRVSEEQLTDLYATCRAVYYAPIDEDFGMVPFEAFRSRKPVVTTTDAGGPLEIVVDGETGRVTEPDGRRLAAALKSLLDDEETARSYGEAGNAVVAGVTWNTAIDRLLAD
jgi:glycosyltransferase involved in cell wall biosynthesis